MERIAPPRPARALTLVCLGLCLAISPLASAGAGALDLAGPTAIDDPASRRGALPAGLAPGGWIGPADANAGPGIGTSGPGGLVGPFASPASMRARSAPESIVDAPPLVALGPDGTMAGTGEAMPVGQDLAFRDPRARPAPAPSMGRRPQATAGPAPHLTTTTPVPVRDRAAPGAAAVAALAVVGAGALAAWGLYHRLDPDEILDNPVRRTIYEAVLDAPGKTAKAYARRAGVDRTTARYHLGILAEFDLVRGSRLRGRTRYFENHGRFGRFAMRVLAHLRNANTRELLARVLDQPGLHYAAIARALGIGKSAVYRKVVRLVELDILEVRDDGRRKAVHPVPDREERLRELMGVVDGVSDGGEGEPVVDPCGES